MLYRSPLFQKNSDNLSVTKGDDGWWLTFPGSWDKLRDRILKTKRKSQVSPHRLTHVILCPQLGGVPEISFDHSSPSGIPTSQVHKLNSERLTK